MNHLKIGIKAREIMDKNFPIIDSSLPLIRCVKKMNNKHGACLVIRKGYFSGVLNGEDILRGFMYGKDKDAPIDKIKMKKNFMIVRPESDIYKTLSFMQEDEIDFVIVKDKNNFLGLITKREIADIEPLLFDSLERRES